MLKINSQKIALILVALITVACSDPKDKYISLQCFDEKLGDTLNLILNKETMTFNAYESNSNNAYESNSKKKEATGQFQEHGENYYLLTINETGKSVYLDRRTLGLKPKLDREESEAQCKKIDLPKEYLNNESDLKRQI